MFSIVLLRLKLGLVPLVGMSGKCRDSSPLEKQNAPEQNKKPRRHGVVRVRQGCYCTAKEHYNLHCYSVIGGGVFLPLRQRVMSFVLHDCILLLSLSVDGVKPIKGHPNDVAKIRIFYQSAGIFHKYLTKPEYRGLSVGVRLFS